MPRRYYSNLAVPQTLTSGIDDDDTTIPVPSTTGYPSVPFTIAIARGTPNEEVVLVQGKSGTQFTDCVRGYDGTAGVSHLAGVAVEHVVAAIDYTEWADHIYNTGLDHHTQYYNTTRLNAALAPLSAANVPIGGIVPYFGTASPDTDRWLLCNGASYSRTTYATLFGVIGTSAGPGDGLSTFNVPDLRGRVPMGLDNMGGASANIVVDGNADVLGGLVGTETVVLTIGQMPTHGHGAGSLVTVSAGAHTHQAFVQPNSGAGTNTLALGLMALSGGTGYTTSSNGAHTHTLTGSTANAGSGQAHPNVQPSMAMAYLIRAA